MKIARLVDPGGGQRVLGVAHGAIHSAVERRDTGLRGNGERVDSDCHKLDRPAHSHYTAKVIAEWQCPCETAKTASRSLAGLWIYQPAFDDPDRAVKVHAG